MKNLLDNLMYLYPLSPHAVLLKTAIEKAFSNVQNETGLRVSEIAKQEYLQQGISLIVQESFTEFVKAVGELIVSDCSLVAVASSSSYETRLVTVLTVYPYDTSDYKHLVVETTPISAGGNYMRIVIGDYAWNV